MYRLLLVSLLVLLGPVHGGVEPQLAVDGIALDDRDGESVTPRPQIPEVTVTPGSGELDQDSEPIENEEFNEREGTVEDEELGQMRGAPYMFENHNPNMTDDGQELFESDMVLTEEQKADRKAAPNLWPGAIVRYTITPSSGADRSAILSAIYHWRSDTCVRFVLVPINYSGPHIRFTKQSGCWSYVGRMNWSQGQDISIGSGCTRLGTVVHEIGHALGFYHEQSRPDRDTYITIHPENIQPGRGGNFAIRSNANNYSVPYDLTSVMHYGADYFSNNGQPTITVNELKYQGLIGRRTSGLSRRDMQLANAMYRCSARCSSPPNCRNGGFVDRFCRCVCPPFVVGTLCQRKYGQYYGGVCGNQNIRRPTCISSLSWPSISQRSLACFWIAFAPAGKRVHIQFGPAKVLYRYRGVCHWDWINVFTNDDNIRDVNACGSELEGRSYTSTGRRLAVEMHSYAYGSYPYHQTGFAAIIDFV